jgi:hypothetical protein
MRLEERVIIEDLILKEKAKQDPLGFVLDTYADCTDFHLTKVDVQEGSVKYWEEPKYSKKVGLPPECCWGLTINKKFKKIILKEIKEEIVEEKGKKEYWILKLCWRGGYDTESKYCFIYNQSFLKITRKGDFKSKKHELGHKAYDLRCKNNNFVDSITEATSRIIANNHAKTKGIVSKELLKSTYLLDQLLDKDRNKLMDIISDFKTEAEFLEHVNNQESTKKQRKKANLNYYKNGIIKTGLLITDTIISFSLLFYFFFSLSLQTYLLSLTYQAIKSPIYYSNRKRAKS